jgi:hypothetical protein
VGRPNASAVNDGVWSDLNSNMEERMNVFKWISINSSWVALVLSIMILEIGECASCVCRWMIRTGAGILGFITNPKVGQMHKKQWLDGLERKPGKLTKVLVTLGMLLGAVPRVWWVLAGEEIPAALYRKVKRKSTGWCRARNSPKPGVEFASLSGGLIAIRSRRSNPGILIFQDAEIEDFLRKIKHGDYDPELLIPNSWR